MGQEPVRLYSKGVVMGYKRGIRLQYPKQVRIKVEGLETRSDTKSYLGKRVAYVYKASNSKGVGKKESKYRVIWGKILAPHGNNGVVKSKFGRNLPPTAIGGSVRVMLYPSRI
ncbi:hypothetical protein NDN08_006237 [Rhodosorus marinus]|uniref:60S ribosomal protein L35a n=1 Tax=Rhodosorus marinus TaxID=101924 RepID=A0AAV8ULN5_9RHOD|nr:hypothetical protein NDN08_006237 [Rhodosorus marinus]